MNRNRQPKTTPLYREEFSDYLERILVLEDGQWRHLTQNAQDSRLSKLTSALPMALKNGDLCADAYDPYADLHLAILAKDFALVEEILCEVKELLQLAQNDSDPDSQYYKEMANWQNAWNYYSDFIREKCGITPGAMEAGL